MGGEGIKGKKGGEIMEGGNIEWKINGILLGRASTTKEQRK